jgi:aliphatic sulfonates family ABC transporter substrate-binding protein
MWMRREHPLFVLAAALAAGLPAAGCTRDDQARPIRFAHQNRVGCAACLVAVEKGFFADEGLAVEASRLNSGDACAEALFTGSADIGDMGDTTAVIAASRGAPLRIIASHGSGEHRHRLVVRGDGAIRRPEDLAGKRLAVKKGTSTYGGLLAFLAARRMAPENIHIVDLRPDDMPDALMAGSVDAFAASEPTPSLAEAQGARELATLGGLGNAYPILILAKTELIETRPGDVRRFLRALDRAERFIAAQPDETAALLARATGLAPETARRAMERHAYRLTLDPDILSSLQDTARFLKGQGIIEAVPDFARAISPECLNAVLREHRQGQK